MTTPVKVFPLVVFRVFFGCLMMFTIIRFLANGWVNQFYIEPKFFFKYFGFEFIKPLGQYTYIIFAIAFFSALSITLGYRYRLSAILFFLSFTYVELMDKTTYLNHYYFVSLISFLLIFLPANAYFSLDAKRNTKIAFSEIPQFNIFTIKLMLSIVYIYSGLAKINSDWLLKAMPLKIWLPARYDIPLLGELFQKEWVHYFMSWSGMLYDLFIPFLLFYKKTRNIAFFLVVVFHMLTSILFPIGIFPFIMILSTLIFFDATFHKKIITYLSYFLKIKFRPKKTILNFIPSIKNKLTIALFVLFFAVQFVFPFRYMLYKGELFWTEEGYRFSWRVMLMEKAGYAQFKIVNPEKDSSFYVENHKFLTDFQQKQMYTQPDFILQYAHFLEGHFQKQGIKDPKVYVESYVALNGRLSQAYIDPTVDLTQIKESFQHKNWILPFNDTIYGF